MRRSHLQKGPAFLYFPHPTDTMYHSPDNFLSSCRFNFFTCDKNPLFFLFFFWPNYIIIPCLIHMYLAYVRTLTPPNPLKKPSYRIAEDIFTPFTRAQPQFPFPQGLHVHGMDACMHNLTTQYIVWCRVGTQRSRKKKKSAPEDNVVCTRVAMKWLTFF